MTMSTELLGELGIDLTGPWVWSGTTEGASSAWLSNFHNGYRYPDVRSSSSIPRAMCVRRSGG